MRCLKHTQSRGATRVEVRQEANDRYFDEMMSKRHRQIFWQDTCRVSNSYYFDTHGDVVLRPGTTAGTYWRASRFPLQDYRFSTPVPSRAVESTSAGR